jgi:methionyl-tRNA formyltransferase
MAPDLLVVAAYGQILSKDVLTVAPLGGINVHASLLPKYRGAAPINWAIYHGETRTGVTIIRMTTGLDAGDMLAQEAIDILPEETAGELEARLGPLGARLAIETVNKLAQGPVAGIPQDKSQVTKAPKLTKEHGLIDWSRGAKSVCNQIRAMQPWPTAYSYLHRPGQESLRLIVHRATSALTFGRYFKSGIKTGAAHVIAGKLGVFCGDQQFAVIENLQPAGKKQMSAQDFLRGNQIPPDAHFGADPA